MRSTERTRNEQMENYVSECIPQIWTRLREACQKKGTSIGGATTAIGMNASAVYATLRDVDAGRPTKDFELYLVKALCDYLEVDIDWVLHGKETEELNATESVYRIMDSLRFLSGGSMKSMMIAMIPFLTKDEQDAMYADIASRLPELN